MQKNDIVKVRIEDVGVGGEGIGKVDGYTLFIKDAIIGDVVEAKIMKAKKNYGYARLMNILTPSEYRVGNPVCQIQEMKYDRQLEFKNQKVRGNLMRIGEVPEQLLDQIMEPIVGMDETEGLGGPYHYRNKAQFPIGTDKEGNVVTGFYAGRTHSIISNTNCALGVEINEQILKLILEFMKEYRISAYDEEKHQGLVRHVLIRYGFTTKEIMVCLVINGERVPHGEVLAKRLAEIEGMTSVTLSVNREKTNVIMGNVIKPLWGQMYITDYIGDVKYQISPLSFFQVNPVQTEKLYKLALEYSGLNDVSCGNPRDKVVWDLYCGIGTISLFLAQKAGKVYGVEIVPQAIDDARNNAKINEIENAEFFVGKAEEVLPQYYENYAKEHGGETAHADVIVVDPPRKGCEESLLQTMVDMKPERIVYVSCDSATLARDVKFLRGNGYELQRVRAVDQFPHTVHTEVVCLLSKLKANKHIEVELEMSEFDLTAVESKATYEEIKDYVLEHSGLKVSNLYIAQVKQKCGIIERANYNLPKSENSRQPKCSEKKRKAIEDALEHFGMI